MKVILLENVKRIGSVGEVIDVKRGFARNFLIANKKALYASKENIKEVEKIKAELSKKDNERKQEAANIVKNTVPNYAYVGSIVKTARIAPIGNFMSFPSEIIRTTTNIAEQGLKEMGKKGVYKSLINTLNSIHKRLNK